MIRQLLTVLSILGTMYLAQAQGSSLIFSSTSRATVASSSKLNLGTGAFTFEANIKVSTIGSGRQIILSNRISGETSGIMFGLYDGHLFTQLGGVAPNIGADQGPNLADGKCHHVALSRSTTGALKFYLDGQKYYDNASTNSISSTGNFSISYDARNGGSSLEGSIDEIRVWNIERSANNIATYSSLALGNPTNQTGLVALWNFNEGTGQIAADKTANGLNVTLGTTANVENSDPTWGVAGCVVESTSNKWLTFEGAQKVRIPSTSALNLGTGAFTFEARINVASTGSDLQMIVSNRVETGDEGFMLGLYNGHLYTQLGGKVPNIGYDQGVDLRDNSCHHIALTRSTTGTLTFYLDGTKYYESARAVNITSSGDFFLGFDADDAGDYFEGSIDEVRIWKTERSAKDIKSYQNVPIDTASKQTTLVALWDLNDGAGQLAKDKSSNALTAILGNTDATESSDPTWGISACNEGTITSLSNTMLASQFTVYPNPFEDQLFISSSKGTVTASLYATTGEQVIAETAVANASAFQIGNELPTGMYLLKVANSTEARYYKVLKK